MTEESYLYRKIGVERSFASLRMTWWVTSNSSVIDQREACFEHRFIVNPENRSETK